MKHIINPILRGFNPDPSILRVEDNYYIATSTFEWFPGVQIHHSKDLIHWKLIAHPLNRVSQLNMAGNPDSCGVWAPCLSYDSGMFYLIYTDVKNVKGNYMDAHNYLVTSNEITGDWSEPIFLNSSGFDPSLFHDDDGRKWLVNMSCDNAKDKSWFGGIILQEFSVVKKKLDGPIIKIYQGTRLGLTEGPHLYKKHGYYYLLTAEGGTGLDHAVTIARSKNITGPYEIDPQNPVLSAKYDPTLPVQKAGHADFIETQTGEVYMVHLCGRPLPTRGVCTLGRETCIQKMVWTEDKWLRLEAGGNIPQLIVTAPDLTEHKWKEEPVRDEFNTKKLDINFNTLRIPLKEDMMSLTERPGFLRLKGRESLNSWFHQSLVARRQQAFCYTATTCIEFEPESFKQMAGLVCYYNTENYHYLRISHDEELGKCLGIITCENYKVSFPLEKDICIEGWNRCFLQARVDLDRLQFYYSKDNEKWQTVGSILDASTLSDEHCKQWWGFTGAFVGICCQDLSGQRLHADFDFFEYIER
jgi:xylan 1,4-beta-xylosidase